ncbi:MAG: N-acetyltransferase [Gemmatimonadota bacterium]
MNPTTRIRRATVADADLVAALGARLFVEAYGPTHPEPDLTPYLEHAFASDLVAEALARPGVVVLLVEGDDGTLIGYAHTATGDAPFPDGVGGSRATGIERFYLDGRWHGRGIADALMTACCDTARAAGADRIYLQVWQEAPRPIAFYRKSGFEVAGSATFRFGARLDDDFLMLRML